MNIRTRMVYRAINLWQRRGRKWTGGRWVEHQVICPVCDGDGEFITKDDVYTCYICNGRGYISMKRYEQWLKEMGN